MSSKLKDPPAIPPEFIHIWEWFEDLNATRFNYVGMAFAFAPLNYTEIRSYFDLHFISAHPDEIRILKLFDGVFLSVMNEEVNNGRKNRN